MKKRGEEEKSKFLNRVTGFVVLILVDSLNSKMLCL